MAARNRDALSSRIATSCINRCYRALE